MPRLRVLAGSSYGSLSPITANSNTPFQIRTDSFEGQITVFIKGLDAADEPASNHGLEYFSREDRKGVTWSIQVQGRFLQPLTADEIFFGNTFDRPLKLPWGSSAALKFMHFIDPTLEHDLQSTTQPWALSPLICTMPYFMHRKASSRSGMASFPSKDSIHDDISQIELLSPTPSPVSSPGDKKRRTSSPRASEEITRGTKRRSFFSQAKHRRAVTFGADDILTTDFCYGFLTFPQLSLNIPGGISFDLNKYWDGQPVRFVCCSRGKDGKIGPHGKIFWCVVIERVDDDDDDDDEQDDDSSVEEKKKE